MRRKLKQKMQKSNCEKNRSYGIFVDNRDSWRGLKKDIETKRAIEAVFNIKDGKIYVK